MPTPKHLTRTECSLYHALDRLLEASLSIRTADDLSNVKKYCRKTDAELHAHSLIQEIDTGRKLTGDPQCEL
jgi:hypothetical protein